MPQDILLNPTHNTGRSNQTATHNVQRPNVGRNPMHDQSELVRQFVNTRQQSTQECPMAKQEICPVQAAKDRLASNFSDFRETMQKYCIGVAPVNAFEAIKFYAYSEPWNNVLSDIHTAFGYEREDIRQLNEYTKAFKNKKFSDPGIKMQVEYAQDRLFDILKYEYDFTATGIADLQEDQDSLLKALKESRSQDQTSGACAAAAYAEIKEQEQQRYNNPWPQTIGPFYKNQSSITGPTAVTTLPAMNTQKIPTVSNPTQDEKRQLLKQLLEQLGVYRAQLIPYYNSDAEVVKLKTQEEALSNLKDQEEVLSNLRMYLNNVPYGALFPEKDRNAINKHLETYDELAKTYALLSEDKKITADLERDEDTPLGYMVEDLLFIVTKIAKKVENAEKRSVSAIHDTQEPDMPEIEDELKFCSKLSCLQS